MSATRPNISKIVLIWLAVATAAISAGGCSEDVTAVLGTDLPFSLYGVLSPQLDSQWVRVYAIEDRLEPAEDEQLDAVFTSIDVNTGEEHVWRDSVIQDAFGHHAHVFWAPFRAEFGHTYHIDVRRSDGDVSTVEVAVPNETELEIQTPRVTSTQVSAPVLIRGDVPRLLRAEVVYWVGYAPAGGAGLESDLVSISYEGMQQEVDEGWIITINVREDFTTVVDTLQQRIERPIDRAVGVMLNRLTLRLIVANEDWDPPGGVFDPEVLVQPESLSNVENGFGYVVAGYRQEITWTPPETVITSSGFRVGPM